jgi:hypothetical protein
LSISTGQKPPRDLWWPRLHHGKIKAFGNEIELFFKALKQNLKFKNFVGTTENALYIQIWAAPIKDGNLYLRIRFSGP